MEYRQHPGTLSRNAARMLCAVSAAITAAVIFVSASAADPTGTWVLWERNTRTPMGSFGAAPECRAAARQAARTRYDVESRRLQMRPGIVELHDNEVHIPVEFEWQIIVYECLSDTINLRRPGGN